MTMRIPAILLGAAALVSAPAAQAETLSFFGYLPANIDLPGEVETIATERLSGDRGAQAEVALADVLGSAQVNGRAWFRILPREAAYWDDRVDAVLRGEVTSSWSRPETSRRTESECAEKNEYNTCIKYELVEIPCYEMRVTVNPRILLFSNDGRQLYSHTNPVSETRNYCKGDEQPSVEEMARGMVQQIATRVRDDLAPRDHVYNVRVMERTGGLQGDARTTFRNAIRQTKTDQDLACESFASAYAMNPNQVSVVFNNGLCHERVGDFDGARALYREALAIDPGRNYPTAGLGRIAGIERAMAQVARGSQEPR
ncbi:MAG: tetratricopeptide repeat protein [Pseudomonadota bacterium]